MIGLPPIDAPVAIAVFRRAGYPRLLVTLDVVETPVAMGGHFDARQLTVRVVERTRIEDPVVEAGEADALHLPLAVVVVPAIDLAVLVEIELDAIEAGPVEDRDRVPLAVVIDIRGETLEMSRARVVLRCRRCARGPAPPGAGHGR